MALTATSAKGVAGIVIESNPGIQLLLASTNISATVTGITAPSGSTGMKFFIRITGWTSSSGTLTITGTGTPNSTETVNVAAPTAQQVQSPQTASWDYVSVNNYTAITNITTTGLTGTITIWGIQAAKYNIPSTSFKATRKVPLYSPNEFSGLMARDKKAIATTNETSIDALDSDWYGDYSLYWMYMLCGAPASWSTLPASPTSLLAAAAISTSQSLTSQPTAPGMKLIFTITTYSGTPTTLTINGTSYGVSTTETLTINANGTYYSANVYSAVAAGGITAGSSSTTNMAISGVFGWVGTVNSESTRYTAAVEFFDGSASWIHPFVCADSGTMKLTMKNAVALTLKGVSQDRLAIGDRTTNPLQTNRTTSIGVPLADLPASSWQCFVYLDPITGTAGNTVFLDADQEIQVTITAKVEPHYLFNNTQYYTRAYPIKVEAAATLQYDIINLIQNEQFRQNLKQYLVCGIKGRYIGTISNTQYNEGWTWTLPGNYDGEYGQEADPTKGNVFAKPKWKCFYDAGIGGSYQLQVVTQQPPTYLS